MITHTAHTTRNAALADFLTRWSKDGRFSWTERHCCHMPAAWVREAEVGMVDMPRTDSARAAVRTVAAHGDLVGAVSHVIGRPALAAAEAQPGDVVAFDAGPLGLVGTVGIAIGSGFVAVCGGETITLHLLADARACWRIA
ncbi:MAG: hypothetical protein RL260_2465 [Pseudomonadota bacterium]